MLSAIVVWNNCKWYIHWEDDYLYLMYRITHQSRKDIISQNILCFDAEDLYGYYYNGSVDNVIPLCKEWAYETHKVIHDYRMECERKK